MALEKVEIVDCIEVIENGSVQVRTKTAIKEDGVEISSKFHRHVVAPGDDYSAEDARVKKWLQLTKHQSQNNSRSTPCQHSFCHSHPWVQQSHSRLLHQRHQLLCKRQ